jgi:hypothetical protein
MVFKMKYSPKLCYFLSVGERRCHHESVILEHELQSSLELVFVKFKKFKI